MTAAPADHALVAYDAFAPAYDHFTAGHDHRTWTGIVLAMAEAAGLTGKRVLEVGCGTGSAMVPMLDRGFEVTGADISPAMVALARDKVEGRAEVGVADMRVLPSLGRFDLVWAICDAVNYLLDDDELVATFRGMRRNLAPRGIVAFDVSCLATLRRFYSAVTVVRGDADIVIFRGGSARDLPAGGAVEAVVEHLREDAAGDTWTSSVSVHRQRHHSELRLRTALRTAGLEVAAVAGIDAQGRRHEPCDDLSHHKAVYIARESASGGEGR